ARLSRAQDSHRTAARVCVASDRRRALRSAGILPSPSSMTGFGGFGLLWSQAEEREAEVDQGFGLRVGSGNPLILSRNPDRRIHLPIFAARLIRNILVDHARNR